MVRTQRLLKMLDSTKLSDVVKKEELQEMKNMWPLRRSRGTPVNKSSASLWASTQTINGKDNTDSNINEDNNTEDDDVNNVNEKSHMTTKSTESADSSSSSDSDTSL